MSGWLSARDAGAARSRPRTTSPSGDDSLSSSLSGGGSPTGGDRSLLPQDSPPPFGGGVGSPPPFGVDPDGEEPSDVGRVFFAACNRIKAGFQAALLAGVGAPLREGNTVEAQPANLVGGVLLPHQIVGLNWLLVLHASRTSGILADAMGLGKTVQVIALLAQLKEWAEMDAVLDGGGGEGNRALIAAAATVVAVEPEAVYKVSGVERRARAAGVLPGMSSTQVAATLKRASAGAAATLKGQIEAVTSVTLAGGGDPAASFSGLEVGPPFARGTTGPHLIVVPTSVLDNWARELGKWCPSLAVVVFAGSPAERRALVKALPTADVVLTSYAVVERQDGMRALCAPPPSPRHGNATQWATLTLDEAHGLRNDASKRFAAIMRLTARIRLLLTGTPLQNSPSELVSLLRFVTADMMLDASSALVYRAPADVSDDEQEEDADAGTSMQNQLLLDAIHKEVARLTVTEGGVADEEGGTAGADAAASTALTDILGCFVLRRTKETVDLNLPPKTRLVHMLAMTPTQQAIADTLHATLFAVDVTKGGVPGARHSQLAELMATVLGPDAAPCGIPVGGAGGEVGASAGAPPPTSASQGPVFFAELRGVLFNDTSSEGAGEGEGQLKRVGMREYPRVGGGEERTRVRRAFSTRSPPHPPPCPPPVLRKVAAHPLLVRTRYGDDDVLKVAELLWAAETESATGVVPAMDEVSLVPKRVQLAPSPTDTSLLQTLAAAHGQLSHGELLAWARAVAVGDDSSGGGGTSADMDVPPAGRKRSASGAVKSAPTYSSQDVGILVAHASSLLSSSDYEIHASLSAVAGGGGSYAASAARWMLPPTALLDSGKVSWLTAALPNWIRSGSRVLLFSQLKLILDILGAALVSLGVEYLRVDGDTPGPQRQVLVDAFNAASSTVPVMLLSTRAGGQGINLASADVVVLYDSDWNPAVDAQAEDRAHRIGQKKPVTVHSLYSTGSFEEVIKGVTTGKLETTDAVLSLV